MIDFLLFLGYVILSLGMSPLLVRYAYWIGFVDSSRCSQRRWADRGEVLLTFISCAVVWPIGFALLTFVMCLIKLYMRFSDKFNWGIDFLADMMWGKCESYDD